MRKKIGHIFFSGYTHTIIFFCFIQSISFFARFCQWWINKEYYSALSLWQCIQSFFYGTLFDIVIFVILFSLPLCIKHFPTSFLPQKLVSFLINILCGFSFFVIWGISISDAIYFGEANRHLASEFFTLGNDISLIYQIITQVFLTEFILNIFFCGFCIAIIWWFNNKYRPEHYSSPLWKRSLLYLCFFVVLFIAGRGFDINTRPLSIVDAYKNKNIKQGNLSINAVFPILNFGYEYLDSQYKVPSTLKFYTEAELQFISKKYFNKEYDTFFRKSYSPYFTQKTNVVLLIIESFDKHFVQYFNKTSANTTPFLNTFLDNCLVYDNFYAHGRRSVEGIQSIMLGVPPLPQIPLLRNGLELFSFDTIGTIAAHQGYKTLFVQGSPRRSFNIDGISNFLGFQEYYGQEDIPTIENYLSERPYGGWDYDGLQFVKKKINSYSENFLAVFFSGSTHTPFVPIKEELLLSQPHDTNTVNGYKNSLRYLDWSLQKFFTEIQDLHWYENTLFIITADHTSRFSPQKNVLQEFQIPFALCHQKHIKKGTNTQLASQIDIFPTLTHALGYNKSFIAIGDSLLSHPIQEKIVPIAKGELLLVIDKHNHTYLLNEPPTPKETEEVFSLQERGLFYWQEISQSLYLNKFSIPKEK